MKCPKCGSTKMKLVDSNDLAGEFYGRDSVRCKSCDYLVKKGSGFLFDNRMSSGELRELHEKGERFTRAWNAEQLINKIKRGW
jgi:transcriptional regulator NrdR family protein